MCKLTKMVRVAKTLCKGIDEYNAVMVTWLLENASKEMLPEIGASDEMYRLYCWSVCVHRESPPSDVLTFRKCIVNPEYICWHCLPGKMTSGRMYYANTWEDPNVNLSLGWKVLKQDVK